MKLYKFRPLKNTEHLKRIKDIIENGFYCCDFLEFNDMNEGVFTVSSINRNINLVEKQKIKICSFSGENAFNRQLMWGHYANAGMGIAIEVNVSGEKCSQIKQVKYSNSTDNLNTIEEILTRKSKEWKYEDEFRYFSSTDDKAIVGKIIKIYFGTPYEKLKNYNDIKSRHKKLKEYLELIGKLESFCKGKKIPCQKYDFK